jgi:hypothetical protein
MVPCDLADRKARSIVFKIVEDTSLSAVKAGIENETSDGSIVVRQVDDKNYDHMGELNSQNSYDILRHFNSFNSSNPNLYQYEKLNLCTRCLTHNSTLKLDYLFLYALYMEIFCDEIFRQHFKW